MPPKKCYSSAVKHFVWLIITNTKISINDKIMIEACATPSTCIVTGTVTGAGTKSWPISRAVCHKPLITLIDGQSLNHRVFLSGADSPEMAKILMVANLKLLFRTEDKFRDVNETRQATLSILKPFNRNTNDAITTATLRDRLQDIKHHYVTPKLQGAQPPITVSRTTALEALHRPQRRSKFQNQANRSPAKCTVVATNGIKSRKTMSSGNNNQKDNDLDKGYLLTNSQATCIPMSMVRLVENPESSRLSSLKFTLADRSNKNTYHSERPNWRSWYLSRRH